MTLDEIYALVPKIECKGLCADQCSVVPMTHPEYRRLREGFPGRKGRFSAAAAGDLVVMPSNGTMVCPILVKGRCSRYANRPLVCRIFGVTEGLACPYGCRPERMMTEAETRLIMESAARLE